MRSCSDHLLVCGWSLVLLLPPVVTAEDYSSSCSLLGQIKMLLWVIHLCYFFIITIILMYHHSILLTWWVLYDLGFVCFRPNEGLLFEPIWSLTIEPQWYALTLDTQVPVFTYICLILFLSLSMVHMVSVDGAPLREKWDVNKMWWRWAVWGVCLGLKCWGFALRPQVFSRSWMSFTVSASEKWTDVLVSKQDSLSDWAGRWTVEEDGEDKM